ncbi:virulence-associated E family protein [Trichocoleus sp. Lan]|uniref:virulence-associated E family protein n=1 Tax=Trichocoleus sp. Lan TaxID=2933927 RepID=UPI0032973714
MNHYKYQQTKQIIETHYSSRLKYHSVTKDIYLDNKIFKIAEFRAEVEENHSILLDADKYIYERAYLCAKNNPFNPLEDYLEDCIKKHPDVDYQEVFDELSEKGLHIAPHNLEAKYLSKTLVGAVARVFDPGCKFDTVLILKGGQGFNKTTFFQELAGNDSFTSRHLPKSNKDELMICNSKWFIELGECESTIKPSVMSELKAFITIQEDSFRKPYADKPITVKRSFILVGTTNQDQFLVDPTGNRRFWVIDINQKINIDWIKKNRDLIWAAAVKAYRAEYPVHLTETQQHLSNAINMNHQQSDMWEDLVNNWVSKQEDPFTLSDVLVKAIGKEPKSWKRSDATRVVSILESMGLKKPDKATRVNGKDKPGKYWDPSQLSSCVTS